MKIAALINGSSKHASRAREVFTSFGEIVVLQTAFASDTARFARLVVVEKFDLVIVAGGDGTLNQVVNEWMRLENAELPSLAVYPIGSANDFARSVGFKNLDAIITSAVKKHFIAADVFLLKTESDTRYCLNLSSCGIGANIAKTVARRRLKWPAKLNYLSATLGWLSIYQAPKVALKMGENLVESFTFMTAIGNGKYAGDGLGLCPQAIINDGKMAITVIGKVGVLDFIKYLPKLKSANQINDPRVSYTSAENLELKVLEGELSIETDGEFFVSLQKGQQVTVSVIKAALRIVNSN